MLRIATLQLLRAVKPIMYVFKTYADEYFEFPTELKLTNSEIL
jgi:hypothetical protein